MNIKTLRRMNSYNTFPEKNTRSIYHKNNGRWAIYNGDGWCLYGKHGCHGIVSDRVNAIRFVVHGY